MMLPEFYAMKYVFATPEDVAERKTRERMALLAMPPEEAQKFVRWGLDGESRDLGGLSVGLAPSIVDEPSKQWDY
jgi:hypothetical protein